MTTGKRLANLRKEYGYTQETLGEHLGVSKQAVSKWESDVTFPETDKLILLSKLFNTSIDYMLCNDIDDEVLIRDVANDKTLTTGLIIANKRKECGYTQESLGEKLGVTRQAVSKWESDITFPETDKLIVLSKLFNTSIDYMLCNNKCVSEEKTNNNIIERIFPAVWSLCFFGITVFLYTLPLIIAMYSGLGNIVYNCYDLLLPPMAYDKNNLLIIAPYGLSNMLILFAFVSQIIMLLMGFSLIYKKDKSIINIRIICSIIECIIWISSFVLEFNMAGIGLVLLVISSVCNLLGLLLNKYNKCNETNPPNKRIYTLLYGLITFIILVVFYTVPIITNEFRNYEVSLISLFKYEINSIAICSIIMVISNLLYLIMTIIIYMKNNKVSYIIRLIISIISFVITIVLFTLLLNNEYNNFEIHSGIIYLSIMQLIIPLGLLLVKNNKFINEN